MPKNRNLFYVFYILPEIHNNYSIKQSGSSGWFSYRQIVPGYLGCYLVDISANNGKGAVNRHRILKNVINGRIHACFEMDRLTLFVTDAGLNTLEQYLIKSIDDIVLLNFNEKFLSHLVLGDVNVGQMNEHEMKISNNALKMCVLNWDLTSAGSINNTYLRFYERTSIGDAFLFKKTLRFSDLDSLNISDFEFSPNGKWLYISCKNHFQNIRYVYVVALDSWILNATNPQKHLLNQRITPRFSSNRTLYLRIGPDNRMYISPIDPINVAFDGRDGRYTVGVIPWPNNPQTQNNYDEVQLDVNEKVKTDYNPRFFPPVIKLIQRNALEVSSFCARDSTFFSATTGYVGPFYWNFGDGIKDTTLKNRVKHLYNISGIYNATVSFLSENGLEKLEKNITIGTISIPSINDKIVSFDSILLDINHNSIRNYRWNNGDTSSRVFVKESGIVSYTISNDFCEYTDTVDVTIAHLNIIQQGGCNIDSIDLVFSTNADSFSITYGKERYSTNYLKLAYLKNERVSFKLYIDGNIIDTSTMLELYQKPQISLGSDSILCSNESWDFKPTISLGDTLFWVNGNVKWPNIPSQTGEYIIGIKNEHCDNYDTVKLSFIDCRLNSDGNCFGDTSMLWLDAVVDSILWDLGDNLTEVSKKTIRHVYGASGTFDIKYTVFSGVATRQLKDLITIYRYPDRINLNDTQLCSNLIFTPDVETNSKFTYLWNDGVPTMNRSIFNSGFYSLTVDNNGCKLGDSLYINLKECECVIFTPNVISSSSTKGNNSLVFLSECEMIDMQLTIFDRWGSVIYQSKGNDLTWSGNNSAGIGVSEGNYLWTLYYRNSINGQLMFKYGTILLLR